MKSQCLQACYSMLNKKNFWLLSVPQTDAIVILIGIQEFWIFEYFIWFYFDDEHSDANHYHFWEQCHACDGVGAAVKSPFNGMFSQQYFVGNERWKYSRWVSRQYAYRGNNTTTIPLLVVYSLSLIKIFTKTHRCFHT